MNVQSFKQLLLSSRPISWVNTAYPFAATYLVFSRHIDITFIVGTVFFLLPYNLLMYGINDVFDYESDLHNPRKNGIEGIKLKPELHHLTIISSISLTLPFVVCLMLLTSAPAAGALAIIVLLVLTYSVPKLRFKERPFVDSMNSSLHFVGPMIFAISATGHLYLSVLPYVLAFFFWGIASHAFGAVQDIAADKAGKIKSIATVLGARPTVWFAIASYGVSICLLLAQAKLSTAIAGFVLSSYVINILPYRNITDATAESANQAWRRFIYLNFFSGLIITLLLIINFYWT